MPLAKLQLSAPPAIRYRQYESRLAPFCAGGCADFGHSRGNYRTAGVGSRDRDGRHSSPKPAQFGKGIRGPSGPRLSKAG
jgi:hypothetical protein